jgi:hypothetical protein
LAANLLELDASIPRMVRDNRAFLTSAAARVARAGVAQWFDGLDIVPPGIAEARRWISGAGGTPDDGLVYPLRIVGIKRYEQPLP